MSAAGATITALNPNSAPAGAPATINVSGSGFAPGAVAKWTQNARTTNLATGFVSDTALTEFQGVSEVKPG
jgi:hypothetical protein